jgi:hypothetical protein
MNDVAKRGFPQPDNRKSSILAYGIRAFSQGSEIVGLRPKKRRTSIVGPTLEDE